MTIKTRNFGEITIDENKVILFEDGIPGFPELKKFLLMLDNEESSPFYWLQSIEDNNICFVIMDLLNIIPDYNPLVEKELIEELGESDAEDLLVYNVAVIPKDIEKMSVNLKAPIVINSRTRKGRQVIANNEEYSIKFYLYEKLKKDKKAGE